MPSAPAPLIVAALGDTIDRIAGQSSYPFRLGALHDDDLLPIDATVRFAYRGPHGFEPPPTKFIGLTLTASILTDIEFAPQTDYSDLPAALSLFERLMSVAQGAGWRPATDQQGLTGPREVEVLAAANTTSPRPAWHLARLAIADDRLLFRLRRVHPTAFLLNLLWSNEALFDRARAITLRLREEDGVPRDLTRPIRPDYPPRARAMLAAG